MPIAEEASHHQPNQTDQQMTNMKKLLMLAAAGVIPSTLAHDATAGTPTQTMVIPSPVNDTAPVSGTPARLRRTPYLIHL